MESLLLPGRDEPDPRDEVTPRSLSAYGRMMLAMQHRILAHVMPATHEELRAVDQSAAGVEGDPSYQRTRANVLERGYVTVC